MFQVVGQNGAQGPTQLTVQLPQPYSVLLGPVAFTCGESVTMRGQHPHDPVLQPHHMGLHGQARADQLADRFLLSRGHRYRYQVAGTIVAGKMDRVQAVGLAAVAGLWGNQAGGNDLAVETIFLETTLQDISGPGCLVATAGSTLFAQSPEHPAHGVEIARQALDLGLRAIAEQNGGGDGILVDIHPLSLPINPSRLNSKDLCC